MADQASVAVMLTDNVSDSDRVVAASTTTARQNSSDGRRDHEGADGRFFCPMPGFFAAHAGFLAGWQRLLNT